MSEAEVVVTAPKATVYVERSIQVRQYESLKVGIHYPVELPMPTDDVHDGVWLEQVNNAIKGAFFTAKAHVYEQAGVKFDDKDGVLVEMVTAKFEGAAEVVASPRPSGASTAVQAERPTVAPAPTPASSGDKACPECGGAMWDNREGKKNPKAPDFKCKRADCDGIIWPPRKAR